MKFNKNWKPQSFLYILIFLKKKNTQRKEWWWFSTQNIFYFSIYVVITLEFDEWIIHSTQCVCWIFVSRDPGILVALVCLNSTGCLSPWLFSLALKILFLNTKKSIIHQIVWYAMKEEVNKRLISLEDCHTIHKILSWQITKRNTMYSDKNYNRNL